MVDVVDSATRSRMMSGIKNKNTQPELALRKQLHALGLRYRLHSKDLPGHPDLVLPKWKTAIFVHGCFWHWHGCSLSKMPQSRHDFWKTKLNSNRERDAEKLSQLLKAGWRCAIVWECAIRGKKGRDNLAALAAGLAKWIIEEQETLLVIDGGKNGRCD